MRYVKPTEKQKIIQVSVDRLYSEADPKYPDYSEKPGYLSNTQRYAEEKFMNSLRSEYYDDLENMNSKSHSKINHSPSRTSYYSSSKLNYKPKSGQMRYGLAERPKKKFVKKVSDSNMNTGQAPVQLKRSITSKAAIDHIKNHTRQISHISYTPIKPHHADTLPVRLSTTMTHTHSMYHLHAHTHDTRKNRHASNQWQFDNEVDYRLSSEKLGPNESDMIQKPVDTQAASRSNSRISIHTRQNSKSRPALQKMKSTSKSIPKKSISSKTIVTSSKEVSISPNRIKIKKSHTVASTFPKTTAQSKSKSTHNRSSAHMITVNHGTDTMASHTQPLSCFDIDFGNITPVKPSNIVPSGHMPDTISHELDNVMHMPASRVYDICHMIDDRVAVIEHIRDVRLDDGDRVCVNDDRLDDDRELDDPANDDVNDGVAVDATIDIQVDGNQADDDFDFDFDDDDVDINAIVSDIACENVVYDNIDQCK